MPEIACLIPVRNGARDLRLCLESVRPLDPVVLALDDGSTDDTREILASHDLVRRVLENPRRETYEGWDDARNRARLLEAAADFAPRWIFWIDADEVLPASDAIALSAFLGAEAIEGVAYGVRVHRMIDDMNHFDMSRMWVYRIFAFDPSHRLPSERLHFTPAPVAIDASHRVRTRFRLMHRASLTAADRERRYAKYRVVDPDREFQASYENLLTPPKKIKRIKPFDDTRDVVIDRELFDALKADRGASAG